ncbi:MAG: hypothetical protein WCY21_02330 [Candidatus Cloacimonadaceae bacterium]|nr:hypothetical protein [Candidatus Cloacimonadota bacterium]MDX9949214.1 hypothetical protein [Candidatus Syntrophosphaera sp.]NLN84960.1 hypothetical protein [Candidatus Cloacimonadota bacterium]
MERRIHSAVGARFIWHREQSRHPFPPEKSGGADRLKTGAPSVWSPSPSLHLQYKNPKKCVILERSDGIKPFSFCGSKSPKKALFCKVEKRYESIPIAQNTRDLIPQK